ncbi:MAG TPA: hypothetical protein DEQ74_00615 [Wolbachia sp.]|uniref:hypothetical protein n=1 Tax=Wolbachia endosymbiont of Pentalonia nigronervosa TaxID=1301914 RepID=UPI000EF03490|nr:hypothetical protein [Wolbachia endosymbiont of Pentalonia nigronervosa]MBD0391866.1 hypothetical protein [Wolbachia endosymbiont of Pentalonia nigronervosa]HCE59329.1 hypothetical protein [Wolbachia sp.]
MTTTTTSLPRQQILGDKFGIYRIFEEAIEYAAEEIHISPSSLKIYSLSEINSFKVYKKICTEVYNDTTHVLPEILSSYVKRACTGEYSNEHTRLSSEECDKFMAAFNDKFNIKLSAFFQAKKQENLNLDSEKPPTSLEEVSISSQDVTQGRGL